MPNTTMSDMQPSDPELHKGSEREEMEERPVDLLCCMLCMDPPQQAKTLSCRHIFCARCLIDYMRDYHQGSDVSFVCPTCRQPEIPESSASEGGRIDETRHPTTNERFETPKRHSNSSNKAPPVNCDVCLFSNKTVETEVYCGKCSLNFCADCNVAHSNHTLFKSHSVVHTSNKDSVNIYCDHHSKLQSHYFCNECQSAGCVVCVLQQHNGHHTSTLMDALTARREKVKAQLNIMGPGLDRVQNKLKILTSLAEKRGVVEQGMYRRSASQPAASIMSTIRGEPEQIPVKINANEQLINKSEDDDSEAETNHLLLPYDRLPPEDENRPNDSPKRPKKVVNHQKRKLSRDSLQPKSPVSGRRLSFLDNFRGKKTSKSEVSKRETMVDDNNRIEGWETRTPTPHRSSKVKSPLSPRSTLPPWQQFIRMGKTSPLVQRRKLATSKSFSGKTSRNVVKLDTPPTTRLMPQIAIDMTELNTYKRQLQALRKLYGFGAKTLEVSLSKRLLEVYDEIVQRLSTAIEVELALLKERVHITMEKHEAAMKNYRVTPSNSIASMELLDGAPRRRHSRTSSLDSTTTPLSAAAEISGVDEEGPGVPLSLLIKPRMIWRTEKHKSDPGDLWNRCGIAFLPNGNTVVAEYDMNNKKNNRLHIYGATGESVRVLCEEEMCPLGVAVTAEGHIAVTDCKSKKVRIVTDHGQQVAEWGKGQFGWPHGIAINSRGQFIVSDAFNDVVSIHHPDGKRIKQFGSCRSGNYHFRNPFHLTVDREDNIIVSDCGNNCIKVFNSNGEFLFKNRGVSSTFMEGFDPNNKNRRLKGPRGVAIDPKGNILVADDNSRVCMFDSRGKYIRNVLTEEENVKFVEGLAVDRIGTIALTECNPGNMFSVKVFQLYE